MAETRLRRNLNRNNPTAIYSSAIHDRPQYLQNNNRIFSNMEQEEVGKFRRALPQFIAVSIKNILLFVYGMTLGFPTIVIPAIQGGDGREPSDLILNREQISWFSSINLICVPLGCLFSGLLTQPIGKRRAMQFVNLPILASWLVFHFATKTEHLYAALCLSGLGGGLMEAPVLTYVAEITEPEYRGILSALGSTCVITGIFIQFIMGSLMDWRTIAAVSSAFPVVCIIALCFVPESPTWLIREQRFKEAVKALQWLRGWVPEHKIEAEFNKLYDELITKPALAEAEDSETKQTCCNKWVHQLLLFRKRSFLVPFTLVAFTFFTGHFSGKTTLQTYAVQIFHTLKAPINKYHATILLGVAEMIATIMCVILIHFTGKRPLVLISTVGVGFCLFGTATYAHFLKIVPGFAINNVVINASSLVPKESIISQSNITDLFDSEQKALLLMVERKMMNDKLVDEDDITTFPPTEFDFDELNAAMNNTMERIARDVLSPNFSVFNNTFIAFDIGDSENTTDPEQDSEDTENATTRVPTTNPSIRNQENRNTKNKFSNEGESLSSVSDILLTIPKQESNYLVWVPLILLLASAFFAHLGIRMIPWILIGEVFPAPVRSTASGLSGAVGYIFGFMANKFFLQMLATLTLPGTFWFYSAVAFFGAITLYFTLPETEGRTLYEIEAHFSKKSDFDLFRKKSKCNGIHTNPIQLDNLQNLHIPITDTKVFHLQQSDLVPNRRAISGNTNSAFEENNTTHL